MSEKPVEFIKTLARYEPATVYIGAGEYVAECVRADDGDYYLAADVDAAIEALRAEVERLNRILGRIVEGDGDSNLTIRAGADAFAAAREYLMTTDEVRGYANSRANAARAALDQEKGQ
jgi:hypothetical protein